MYEWRNLPKTLSVDNRTFDVKIKKYSKIKSDNIEASICKILCYLDKDPLREGLVRTPIRVAKSLEFLTSGHFQSVNELTADALFEAPSNDLIIQKNIEFYSLCEHHMLPFFGKIHVAYVPNKKIIGLSKIVRIINIFARRLQVQERLTLEITQALEDVIKPYGVAVQTQASHFCMMMRGVEKQGSTTITQSFLGLFKSDAVLRSEFRELLRNG